MSEAVKELQRKIGVLDDGDFGKKSALAFMNFYKLSKEQTAHFLGQCYHETGGFKLFEENLNYSAEGLVKIFSKYFPNKQSTVGYARVPQKIANKVYANRMGNGDEFSGMGFKFRGRGALQTTGYSNYKALSDEYKDASIISNPEIVATKYAFESALFYFKKRNLWISCVSVNEGSIKKVTKTVNGGQNGLEDRIKWTNYFYNLISK